MLHCLTRLWPFCVKNRKPSAPCCGEEHRPCDTCAADTDRRELHCNPGPVLTRRGGEVKINDADYTAIEPELKRANLKNLNQSYAMCLRWGRCGAHPKFCSCPEFRWA